MYKQYEKDETNNLMDIVSRMNELHSTMGGRDNRPERKALIKCIGILSKCVREMREEYLKDIQPCE